MTQSKGSSRSKNPLSVTINLSDALPLYAGGICDTAPFGGGCCPHALKILGVQWRAIQKSAFYQCPEHLIAFQIAHTTAGTAH